MLRPGVTALAAAALAVAFAAPGAAQAAVPCAPIATSYETGGAATSASPNDPLLSRQWGLTQIKAQGAWSRGALGSGATIAIVDTGVDLNHPDLKGNLLPGVDLVSGETCTPGAQDQNGHGTHVAGIAAASTNNGIGIAGVAPLAKILPVRVLDSTGSGTYASIVAKPWSEVTKRSVLALMAGWLSSQALSCCRFRSAFRIARRDVGPLIPGERVPRLSP